MSRPSRARIAARDVVRLATTLALSVAFPLALAGDDESSWACRLYTATYITKIQGEYFLVDCWHHRVLYSDDLDAPVSAWHVLDDDLAGPHSIATDGELLVTEDTGRGRLAVYRRRGAGGWERVQTVPDVGGRPHRTVYDPMTRAFYCVASTSQEIVVLERDGSAGLRVAHRQKLPYLEGAYVRSFTLIGGEILFVSGPGRIIAATYADREFSKRREYRVPPKFASMNDLYFDGRRYVFTATPRAIAVADSLEAFERGEFEDVYDALRFRGTPYYVSAFDGALWIPEITEYTRLRRFDGLDADSSVETLIDSGPPSPSSARRKRELPL